MVCIMNVCNIENLICNLMKLKLYKRKITFWGHKFGDQDWKLKKKPLQENKIFNKFLSFSWQGVLPKWRLSRVIVVCEVFTKLLKTMKNNSFFSFSYKLGLNSKMEMDSKKIAAAPVLLAGGV